MIKDRLPTIPIHNKRICFFGEIKDGIVVCAMYPVRAAGDGVSMINNVMKGFKGFANLQVDLVSQGITLT